MTIVKRPSTPTKNTGALEAEQAGAPPIERIQMMRLKR
jgi:hypothetical protein